MIEALQSLNFISAGPRMYITAKIKTEYREISPEIKEKVLKPCATRTYRIGNNDYFTHLLTQLSSMFFAFTRQCIRASSLLPCFDCTLYTSLVFNGGVRHWESSPLMMKLRYLRQTRISSPSLFSLGKIRNLKLTRWIFRNQWWTLFLFSKSFSKETHFFK